MVDLTIDSIPSRSKSKSTCLRDGFGVARENEMKSAYELAMERLQKGAPRIVTDPDPANRRAVRAYEKAGFEKHRMVETSDGPALLMVRNP